jgi:prophage regulatory protein
MTQITASPFTILRRRQVEGETGLSRSTIYARISERLLTKPVNLGPRAVGWPASEIRALNAARIAGRSDDQIRELVSELERVRVTADDPR